MDTGRESQMDQLDLSPGYNLPVASLAVAGYSSAGGH